jgi:hypothetical protein
MTRKRITVGLAVLLFVVLGVVVQRVFVLPPPDLAAKSAVGDRAPDFTLSATTEPRLALADLVRKGPLVLVFYRGDW